MPFYCKYLSSAGGSLLNFLSKISYPATNFICFAVDKGYGVWFAERSGSVPFLRLFLRTSLTLAGQRYPNVSQGHCCRQARYGLILRISSTQASNYHRTWPIIVYINSVHPA